MHLLGWQEKRKNEEKGQDISDISKKVASSFGVQVMSEKKSLAREIGALTLQEVKLQLINFYILYLYFRKSSVFKFKKNYKINIELLL